MARYKCMFSVSGSRTITSNSSSASASVFTITVAITFTYFKTVTVETISWLGQLRQSSDSMLTTCYQAIRYQTFKQILYDFKSATLYAFRPLINDKKEFNNESKFLKSAKALTTRLYYNTNRIWLWQLQSVDRSRRRLLPYINTVLRVALKLHGISTLRCQWSHHLASPVHDRASTLYAVLGSQSCCSRTRQGCQRRPRRSAVLHEPMGLR